MADEREKRAAIKTAIELTTTVSDRVDHAETTSSGDEKELIRKLAEAVYLLATELDATHSMLDDALAGRGSEGWGNLQDQIDAVRAGMNAIGETACEFFYQE